VLISAKPGAPTVDQGVNYLNTEGNQQAGTPPLQSLTVENPQGAAYLSPVRATGNLLTLVKNYPNWSRAKFERYVLIRYPMASDLSKAMAAFQSDPYVEAVYLPSTTAQFFSASAAETTSSAVSQYGRDDINIDAAWQIAGGYALIGDVDSGLYEKHPALAQFDTNDIFIGGNFSPAASFSIGQRGQLGFPSDWTNLVVDELWGPIQPALTTCNSQSVDAAIPPIDAGHGTHVAGLIAANPNSNLGVKGSCKHCGIAEVKISFLQCKSNGKMYQFLNPDLVGPAIEFLADDGAQVINLSLGDFSKASDYCSTTGQKDLWCTAIAEANGYDVTLVASAGNNRTDLAFPANDSRVLDAGGFEESLALWDLSPGSIANCPPIDYVALGKECGSDFQTAPSKPPQELMASANKVSSTTYPQVNWNSNGCGDGYPGPGWGNGVGLCTGTSMAAPQISGVVGILRSINPLVSTGVPAPPVGQALGIRAVLSRTTVETQANPNFYSPALGYGHPDTAAAARMMLGTVAGRRVINRVTPLFRLYSSVTQDYADTTSPQFAIALMLNDSYVPKGLATPAYDAFPNSEPGAPPLLAPKAKIYVLTTEFTPQPGYPPLVPLYVMDRRRNWPLGCLPGAGCNSSHRDFTLMTTPSEVQQAHVAGFELYNIQGYIYQRCNSEPQCIPPGAQPLYRECNTSVDDCAIFLESERVAFENAGYKNAGPIGNSKVLGYAYSNLDSDGDGLVDGMEYVIGTNLDLPDSDGVGATDGVAYPQAGVPVSDPCLGPGAISCPADEIFKDGYQ